MAYNGCDDHASYHLWEFVIHPGWTTGWHVCKRCERSINCDCDHEKWFGGCKYVAVMDVEAQKAWVEQQKREQEEKERQRIMQRANWYLPNGKLLMEGNSND